MKRLSAGCVLLAMALMLFGCADKPASPDVSQATSSPAPAPTATLDPSQGNEEAVFALTDLTVEGLRYRAKEAEVEQKLGKPDRIESSTESDVEVWIYGEDALSFQDGELLKASITRSAWTGPRGLKVGASLQDVLASFRRETGSGDLLYAAHANNGEAIAPRGDIYRTDAGEIYEVVYTTPDPEYDDTILGNEKPANAAQMWMHGTARFTIDGTTEQVVAMEWEYALPLQ